MEYKPKTPEELAEKIAEALEMAKAGDVDAYNLTVAISKFTHWVYSPEAFDNLEALARHYPDIEEFKTLPHNLSVITPDYAEKARAVVANNNKPSPWMEEEARRIPVGAPVDDDFLQFFYLMSTVCQDIPGRILDGNLAKYHELVHHAGYQQALRFIIDRADLHGPAPRLTLNTIRNYGLKGISEGTSKQPLDLLAIAAICAFMCGIDLTVELHTENPLGFTRWYGVRIISTVFKDQSQLMYFDELLGLPPALNSGSSTSEIIKMNCAKLHAQLREYGDELTRMFPPPDPSKLPPMKTPQSEAEESASDSSSAASSSN